MNNQQDFVTHYDIHAFIIIVTKILLKDTSNQAYWNELMGWQNSWAVLVLSVKKEQRATKCVCWSSFMAVDLKNCF